MVTVGTLSLFLFFCLNFLKANTMKWLQFLEMSKLVSIRLLLDSSFWQFCFSTFHVMRIFSKEKANPPSSSGPKARGGMEAGSRKQLGTDITEKKQLYRSWTNNITAGLLTQRVICEVNQALQNSLFHNYLGLSLYNKSSPILI